MPCCGQQEEPAILISRLLRMRCMYSVCGQHLFGLPLRMNGMHKTQFDHAFRPSSPRNVIRACFDHLLSETWEQSTVLEQKRLDL